EVVLLEDDSSSDLIGDLSYSGPSGDARIQPAQAGSPLFTDHKINLPELPDFLQGGEVIQMPNSDWNYSAVDLMQFSVKKHSVVYVAHDVRLEPLPWLKNNFTDTGKELVVGPHRWRLFQTKLFAYESILIGSNAESESEKRWMMTVFVVPE
ncbi:MAG TPA: hypothetical protein VJ904_02815, partial [Tichowtungia sp.]|nr:hypothetical protein [Tichowtungia sp.]